MVLIARCMDNNQNTSAQENDDGGGGSVSGDVKNNVSSTRNHLTNLSSRFGIGSIAAASRFLPKWASSSKRKHSIAKRDTSVRQYSTLTTNNHRQHHYPS
ncbi:unnamed protein product, partial [Didymodactylos carnosus]